MKSRMMIGLLVIAIVAAVIGGGTMAWFTAKANVDDVVFQAGTVMIAANEKFELNDVRFTNVNPGDCYCFGWEIVNTGTKAIVLRAVGGAMWEFDYNWVWDNRDALCYSDEMWGNQEEMMNDSRFEAGEMGNPLNPAAVFFCEGSDEEDWKLVLVDEDGEPTYDYQEVAAFHMYYTGEPIEPGESVQLCLCVLFNGELMDNIFQGATFTISGLFEAVQASNDAPEEVWGDVWNAEGIFDPRFEDFNNEDCVDLN